MVWELGRWVPHDVHYAGFAPCDVALFGFCRRVLRQLVHECPIGQLVCWKHGMDTAYLPKLPLITNVLFLLLYVLRWYHCLPVVEFRQVLKMDIM